MAFQQKMNGNNTFFDKPFLMKINSLKLQK